MARAGVGPEVCSKGTGGLWVLLCVPAMGTHFLSLHHSPATLGSRSSLGNTVVTMADGFKVSATCETDAHGPGPLPLATVDLSSMGQSETAM